MLRARQRIGKYRIVRRIGDGGFASVFEALDTIEGLAVALKVPHDHLVDLDARRALENEIKQVVRLEHPNVLRPKNATVAGGRFVVAYPLGIESLAERMKRRMARGSAVEFAEQAIAALAHAHSRKIIHCDVKPENFILFEGNRIRLTDFGIAKVAARTVRASGSGTLGYLAPEQAMGRPSFRSDVFALGLLLHRLFSGALPEWPFEKPLPGEAEIESRYGADLRQFLGRALELEPRRRFRDAEAMLDSWSRLEAAFLNRASGPGMNWREGDEVRRANPTTPRHSELAAGSGSKSAFGARRRGRSVSSWRALRRLEYRELYSLEFGKDGDIDCRSCRESVAASMAHCPWCGEIEPAADAELESSCRCPRCSREVLSDWKYCGWCYGEKIGPRINDRISDQRYREACGHCDGPMFAHSSYCPWCRRRAEDPHALESSAVVCPSCGGGVAEGFWHHCAWCGESIEGG